MAVNPERIIDVYMQWRRLHSGWVPVSRDGRGAQFSIPRRYKPLAFWVGLLTFWLYGFGILIWILGGIDYIFSGKGPFYVSVADMERQLKARKR